MNYEEMRRIVAEAQGVALVPLTVSTSTKKKRKPKQITSRRYNVTAYAKLSPTKKKFDERFRPEIVENVSFKKAKELAADFRKSGFGRVDIVEITTRIRAANGGTQNLTFTPKNYVPVLEGSIPYVEARLSLRQIVRKDIAIVQADAKYFSEVNGNPRVNGLFGPREIRNLR